MNSRPILFWPKSRSEIERHLDRDEDEFFVVDTNSVYELQKLYKLRPNTPIFDPLPGHGEHYRDFIDHIVATDCRCHIAGLDVCREVLLALRDPSLKPSSIGEIFEAIAPSYQDRGRSKSKPATIIDWSSLNWSNTCVLTALVFSAALIGNVIWLNDNSLNNDLLAAAVATILFAVFYVCVRANAKLLKASRMQDHTWGMGRWSGSDMIRRFRSGSA